MCRVGVCCYQWASCVVSEAGLLSLQGKEKNWRRGRARVLLLERHWFDSPGQHLVAQPLPSVYVMYIWITVSRRNGRPLKALKCDAKTLWRAVGGEFRFRWLSVSFSAQATHFRYTWGFDPLLIYTFVIWHLQSTVVEWKHITWELNYIAVLQYCGSLRRRRSSQSCLLWMAMKTVQSEVCRLSTAISYSYEK